MLWLVIKGASHQIISCNVHQENGKFQLWVERPNGKNMKIVEDTNEAEVLLVKEAIDYAIENNESTLRLA